MAGILTLAVANPSLALAKLQRGDVQSAMAIGNLLGGGPAGSCVGALTLGLHWRLHGAFTAGWQPCHEEGEWQARAGSQLGWVCRFSLAHWASLLPLCRPPPCPRPAGRLRWAAAQAWPPTPPRPPPPSPSHQPAHTHTHASQAPAALPCPAVALGSGAAEQAPHMVATFGGDRLLDAVAAQMAAARRQRDYSLWRATMLLATNCTRFSGEQGDGYRRRLMAQGGRPAACAVRLRDERVCQRTVLAALFCTPSAVLGLPEAD